jgi:outer membrane protein TolC
VPASTAGAERAIALYHQGRSPAGALALRREDRNDRGERQGHDDDGSRRAEVALDAKGALTADKAIAMAKANSARLAALEAHTATAAAEVAATDQYQNPSLSVSNLHLDDMVRGKPQVRTAIRVPLSRPGEIAAKVAEARAAEATARAQARAEELAIESDVRWLFEDVVLLDAEIAAVDAVAAARRSLAVRMKERLDASETTAIEEAMVELAAVEAEQDSAEWSARRGQARADLLDRVGLDPGSSVVMVGDSKVAWPPPELPAEETLVDTALRSRPEIQIAAARIDGADARVHLESVKRLPWLSSVEVGYDFAPDVAAGIGWVFKAGIDLPIFDTNRAAFGAATTARTAEKRALAADVEGIAREVRKCLGEARVARALVTELQRRAPPVAERAAVETKRALDGRGIDVVRALSVDEHRVIVELRLLRSIRRYRTAVADLRRAVGGQLPTETR